MANLVTFLTFKDRAEEAANFYCAVFPDSRIANIARYPDVAVAPSPGAVMIVELELLGQRLILLNGGAHFTFTDGMSILVQCDTQAEIDRYWRALTADGGEPGPCGWLKDKFGVSWQVGPKNMNELVAPSGDPARAKRVMECMMTMSKIDIAALERAAAAT